MLPGEPLGTDIVALHSVVVLTHTYVLEGREEVTAAELTPLSALSETQNQFAASDEKGWVCDAPPTQTGREESGKQAQNMSKVFRRGDYNIIHEDPLERFQSVQMKDYLPARAKADIHGTGALAVVSFMCARSTLSLSHTDRSIHWKRLPDIYTL